MALKEKPYLLRVRLCYLSNSSKFFATFQRPLSRFWDNLTGFDVVKFDDDFIKAPRGKSTHECVTARFGADAAVLIDKLIRNEE